MPVFFSLMRLILWTHCILTVVVYGLEPRIIAFLILFLYVCSL